jgi:hypothetical protein
VNPTSDSQLVYELDGRTKIVALPIEMAHLKTTCQRIATKVKVVSNESDLIEKSEKS